MGRSRGQQPAALRQRAAGKRSVDRSIGPSEPRSSGPDLHGGSLPCTARAAQAKEVFGSPSGRKPWRSPRRNHPDMTCQTPTPVSLVEPVWDLRFPRGRSRARPPRGCRRTRPPWSCHLRWRRRPLRSAAENGWTLRDRARRRRLRAGSGGAQIAAEEATRCSRNGKPRRATGAASRQREVGATDACTEQSLEVDRPPFHGDADLKRQEGIGPW
jgi:hypothetical protein